jgi:NTP pyrophosphatase (non-canonical NTP hydrolase)
MEANEMEKRIDTDPEYNESEQKALAEEYTEVESSLDIIEEWREKHNVKIFGQSGVTKPTIEIVMELVKTLATDMSLNEYQMLAGLTSIHGETIDKIVGDNPKVQKLLKVCYGALGLGEAGEIQGKVKKIIRDNNGDITGEIEEDLMYELGDLLWYVAETASQLDLTLEEVAQRNIQKLKFRKAVGTLQGSGDNR